MKLIVRFSGILTFVAREDRIIVLAPNSGSRKDIRLPYWLRRQIPVHRLELEINGGRVLDGRLPQPHGSYLRLETPWSEEGLDLSPLRLPNLTRISQEHPVDASREDVLLAGGLLERPFGSFEGSLATGLFEFGPGAQCFTEFYQKWSMSYRVEPVRSFTAEVSFHYQDIEPCVILKAGQLAGDDEEEVKIVPEDGAETVEIRYHHFFDGLRQHDDHPHFALHYHLLNRPQRLSGRFVVPVRPAGLHLRSPLGYGPPGLNPQCSPAEVEFGP